MRALDRFSILQSADPDEAFANIRARHPGVLRLEATVGEAGWRVRTRSVALGAAQLSSSQSSEWRVSFAPDAFVRFYLPFGAPVAIRQGGVRRELARRAACWSPAGPHETHANDGYDTLVIALNAARLVAELEQLDTPVDLADALDRFFGQEAPGMALFRIQAEATMAALNQHPETIVDQNAFRNAHEELLTLCAAGGIASAGKPPKRQTASPVALGRALEFIESAFAEDIGPTAIANAAGCNLRGLRALFRAELGATISGYLRRRRLDAARARLLRAAPGDNVAGIARASGFNNLVDFGKCYRNAYGEQPEATLAAILGRTQTPHYPKARAPR